MEVEKILPKKIFNHFTEFHNLKSNFIKVITENFRNHFFENPLDYKCFFYITLQNKITEDSEGESNFFFVTAVSNPH